MDDQGETSGTGIIAALWRALRPALPAVIVAAAATFLLGAIMPLAWVAGISWNLYLDRLSDLFVPPVGNGGRIALALGMAAVAAILAGFVALAAKQPLRGGWPLRGRAAPAMDEEEAAAPRRRRADVHPDDPPRPPIRAGRDLPAGGLGPLAAARAVEAADEPDAIAEEDELILADLAPDEPVPGHEPWLQPAELAGASMPDPADKSLGAMVARFEAGLARRRLAQPAAASFAPAAAEGEEGEVDFALEAALGTLQRMSRQAVG